ncbi:MAG: hypothetical protein DA328_00360 [Nitrososphaeraceae archaeon]|nr:hypothetical protein [Nitrososphaeraceae archaeon]
MKKNNGSTSMVIISGSCINFDKERNKIVRVIEELQMDLHIKTEYEVYSNGSALGWDFFLIHLNPSLLEEASFIIPKINKQEGDNLEQKFVIWLSKVFKEKKDNYFLKIVDKPYETVSGFRLDPNNYRNDNMLKDLR